MLLIVLSGAINRIGKGRPRLSGLAGHGVEALLHRGIILDSAGLRCGCHRAARVPAAVPEGGLRGPGGPQVHCLHQGGSLNHANSSRPVFG